MLRMALISLMCLCINLPCFAIEKNLVCDGIQYGKGKKAICLPLGAISFADTVVSFVEGDKPSKAPFDNPQSAIGEPDYKNTRSPDFISLGCDGVLTLKFIDNVLIDVAGFDLYVFEVGPFVEQTELQISNNGTDWISVGEIKGSRSDIDIAPYVEPNETFAYVRLLNRGKSCGGKHSGADIDAVAAVGAEIRYSLSAAVLFDVGDATLKAEASKEIEALAQQLLVFGNNMKLTIAGHTDNTGTDEANQALSEARANSVWQNLSQYLPEQTASIKGYGEKRPIDSNDSETGRANNRRVDILVSPNASSTTSEL